MRKASKIIKKTQIQKHLHKEVGLIIDSFLFAKVFNPTYLGINSLRSDKCTQNSTFLIGFLKYVISHGSNNQL